jgi:septal ring factor EnvC (AmiA/AmiB activator)
MKKIIWRNVTLLLMSVLASILIVSAGIAFAADQEHTRQQTQTQMQEQIYGSQLMTEQERAEYHARMRAAKTAEEREKIRKEHHERMKERAKEQGVTLPDDPPERGMGPGGGMGPAGGGMGPGGRKR